MSEMSFEEDWNNGDLKKYSPGAQFIAGVPFPDFINDPFKNLMFERSVNLPFLGETTIGENVAMDDYARFNRAMAQGDTSQALKSLSGGLFEAAGLVGGLGGLGTLAVKGGSKLLPNIFGRSAPAVTSSAAKTAGSSSDSIIGRLVAESRAKAAGGVPSSVAPKPKVPAKGGWLNPKNLPKGGKVGLAATGVAGILGLLGSILDENIQEPTQAYTPKTLPNSVPVGPVDTTQNILDIIREGQARQEANIRQQREDALAGFGTEERQAFAEWANMLDRARRGQTSAIRGDYQALYDRLAGDVGAIEGMGAAGGQAANRRYRQAARRARREGRQENVRSGLGGLTPVSGRMADMPANLRGQGADLAQYIRNNAAVAARDAGFDAEASLEYGNAMANEFNQNLALLQAQQEFDLNTQLAREKRAIGMDYDRMLAELAGQGIDAETAIAVEQAQREAAAGAVSGVALLAHPEAGPRLEREWEIISSILSGNIPEGTPQSRIDRAYQVADELNARYGRYDLETFAEMFADTEGGPESLGVQ